MLFTNVNGGSSVPARFDCKYDETAVYPAAPGNSPGYTITVNTNGAEGMVSPVTAFRSFLNWGDAVQFRGLHSVI